MRRFPQSRTSLPAPRSCPPVLRFYSTEDGHVETTAPQPKLNTQPATSHTTEPDLGALFNFDGTWSGVNPDDKTIKTAVGPLPVSPLMDPTWRKAKKPSEKKKKQPPPFQKMGRFQRLIKQNPYAQMLAEPVRACQATRARLPRPFLQGFGLVTHPETKELWWVPAGIEQQPRGAGKETPSEDQAQTETSHEEVAKAIETPSEDQVKSEKSHDEAAEARKTPLEDESRTTKSHDEFAEAAIAAAQQITEDTAFFDQDSGGPHDEEPAEPHGEYWAPAHVLARQDLLLEFNTKNRKHSGAHFRFAALPSVGSKAARAIWRKDMNDVLREHMRRGVVDELVYASQVLGEGQGRVTLIKLDKVEDSLKYQNRVCFLLLSGEHRPFDYLEVPGVPGSARAAYHLPELLGAEQLQRLETEAPRFQDGPLLLLKGKGNVEINKKLWRLVGFVADYEKLK